MGWGLGHSSEWAREGQELPTSLIGLQSGVAAPESHRAGFKRVCLLDDLPQGGDFNSLSLSFHLCKMEAIGEILRTMDLERK